MCNACRTDVALGIPASSFKVLALDDSAHYLVLASIGLYDGNHIF